MQHKEKSNLSINIKFFLKQSGPINKTKNNLVFFNEGS